MPRLDLIYEKDCPNVRRARANLRKALDEIGCTERWIELLIGDPEAPAHARGYGSPTILVDGEDVAGMLPSSAEASCRLYAGTDAGVVGAPSVTQIAEAIRRRTGPGAPSGSLQNWCSAGCAAPAIATAFLPVVSCPACWPAYAGLLSSAGLGFLVDTAWLFVVTMVMLLLSLGALAFRSSRRHGPGPFLIGLAAVPLVLLGKFLVNSSSLLYVGVAGLIAASLWNSWPKRARALSPGASCSAPLQKGQDES